MFWDVLKIMKSDEKSNITEEFVTKKGENVTMHGDEIARWCCLVEAVQVIDQRGSQLGLDMDKGAWVKPIAIQKYIDERFDTMIEEIEREKTSYPLNL